LFFISHIPLFDKKWIIFYPKKGIRRIIMQVTTIHSGENGISIILSRIIDYINEEGVLVGDAEINSRPAWKIYKKEVFLDKMYGEKIFLIIEKDIRDGVICICRDDILGTVIREFVSNFRRKKIRVEICRNIK